MSHKFLQYIAWLTLTLPILSWADNFSSQQWQTKQGARAVFFATHEIPMLEINIAFRAGAAYDTIFGQSALTTRLLNQGTHRLSANQIADKLAATGAQVDLSTSQDMTIIRARTLTEQQSLSEAIRILAMIIQEPDFPRSAFEQEKSQQLMEIRQMQESPDSVATELFFSNLYINHPYAHPINGTIDSVKQLTLDQVKNFYHQYFVANNMVIVMVGAINQDQAHAIAETLTSHLPAGRVGSPIPAAKALRHKVQVKQAFPATQTMIRLGQLGITHQDQEYFALMVGNYILGGGSLVSKLAEEVREKRGLTYGVYSQFMPMLGTGPFMIGLSTKSNQAQEAVNITEQTLRRFLRLGPSIQDLQDAKAYLIGSFPLTLASNKSIAEMLLRITFYGLPKDYLDTYPDHINQTSAKDIKNAFTHHIHPEQWLQVSVGPS